LVDILQVRGIVDALAQLLAPERCAGCDTIETLLSGIFCASCHASAQDFHGRGAVFEYGGPVADAIQRFKYGGRSELASVLGARMALDVLQWGHSIDVVVPIPLHWRKRLARGYDQAALLALPVARALGVPACCGALKRVRSTRSQAELPRSERLQNVKGAFRCRSLRNAPVVLLVDDVRTTGATIGAASDALVAAGARRVHALTLAVRLLGEST
jgi:ComF family protein